MTIARALIKRPACLILDEATAALDNETQKRVSENISRLQREEGFTIVQIAHRLTTLTNSDIVYFLNHGVVVETGGLETQAGTAVQELNKVQIKRKAIVNPETKKEEQRMTQGFFHQLWDVANDVKSFQELPVKELLAKVRELRDDLDMAQAEVQRKASELLPLPRLALERAGTAPAGEQLGKLAEVAVGSSSTVDQGLSGARSPMEPKIGALLSLASIPLERFFSA